MHVKHARNFYKDVKDPLTLEELQDAMAGKDGKAASAAGGRPFARIRVHEAC